MDKAASRIVLISLEASLEACFAMASGEAFEPFGREVEGCTRGRIFMASWGGKGKGYAQRGAETTTDLFFGDIVRCEFYFAHAACAQRLCEGIVAEDSICGAGLLRGRGVSVLAMFLVVHGQSLAIRRACLWRRAVGLRGHRDGPGSVGRLCPRGRCGEWTWDGRRRCCWG